MPLHHAPLLDFAQEVEDLLGAAHGKAGDDHIAAPVEGGLQHIGQVGQVIWPGAVQTVAVGGFHHHIVGLGQVVGVVEDGLMQVPDIP